MRPSTQPRFSLLAPPYRELLVLDDEEEFPEDPRVLRGAALFWRLSVGQPKHQLERVAKRPGGLSLMVMLPKSGNVSTLRLRALEVLATARPHAILPYHAKPSARELCSLLRAGPEDLAGELLDFLAWRGFQLQQETRQLLRRTVELSGELTTLSSLARGVYVSRRALGRRFQKEGIPVPSHWLQFSRLFRAVVRLQNSRKSVCEVAASLGYPDGFTLSSQMARLVGVRPSVARERLGWEWFTEAWLRQEWATGGLRVSLRGLPGRPTSEASPKRLEFVSDNDGV